MRCGAGWTGCISALGSGAPEAARFGWPAADSIALAGLIALSIGGIGLTIGFYQPDVCLNRRRLMPATALMAVLAFGEGYHNYHHSFPFDYRNGIKPWHFDPAKWAIWTLSRLGLARDLRRIVRTRIAAGDADNQTIEWVVARYGDFVRLRPPRAGMI